MALKHWQLSAPVSAIVFDCDGTLSRIEGIDELAKHNGVSDEVTSLTELAMGQSGLNEHLYQTRLELVYPTKDQVHALGQQYADHQVPDVDQVIRIFHRLNKTIYIVSAGLYPAVKIFGDLLQIPSQRIFAVDIEFDPQGKFVAFDRASPLVRREGKRTIVSQLKQTHPQLIHVGDGMNDYVAHDLATRFIGYGGAFYRENIAACCDYYIKSLSLAPLLPLALTQGEYESLLPPEQLLYQQGVSAIEDGKVMLK